ncbi:hypothetical protein AAG906_008752 [Vitis piasezkii]
MKWEMEIEEIEAILEKIWDLHDKLSDAIHSISRFHFLNSIKSLRKSDKSKPLNDADENRFGFVYAKDFRVEDDDLAIQEAKSLNAIRTALENLEDQLEFFHTVQVHQQAERDAAIARLEQSRIVLAIRLSEHHGKKYKVIEEAMAFVGDVRDAGPFVLPDNLFGPPVSLPGKNVAPHEEKRSNFLIKVLISCFNFGKKSLKLDHMGGILGNAALVAVSMLALLHLNQVTYKDKIVLEPPQKREDNIYRNQNVKRTSRVESSLSSELNQLDVLYARG